MPVIFSEIFTDIVQMHSHAALKILIHECKALNEHSLYNDKYLYTA